MSVSKGYFSKEDKCYIIVHPLHGKKYINYATKDTNKGRAECLRILQARCGTQNETISW